MRMHIRPMTSSIELMRMILTFDALGRDALGKGADMKALFAIGAEERIGRAKMAAPDTYKAEYASILEQMKNEIDAVIAGGEDCMIKDYKTIRRDRKSADDRRAGRGRHI